MAAAQDQIPVGDLRAAGPCIIVTWEFEAEWLTLALNPSDWAHDIACTILSMPVVTGSFDQNGETLRLKAWSAVAWATGR